MCFLCFQSLASLLSTEAKKYGFRQGQRSREGKRESRAREKDDTSATEFINAAAVFNHRSHGRVCVWNREEKVQARASGRFVRDCQNVAGGNVSSEGEEESNRARAGGRNHN